MDIDFHMQSDNPMASETSEPDSSPEPSLASPLLLHQNETTLNVAINHLEYFLHTIGFLRTSFATSVLSWIVFFIVSVVLPFVLVHLSSFIGTFEIEVMFFDSLMALISLVCLSHCLRKHGVKKLLLLDRLHGQTIQFRHQYAKKINGFFWVLMWWLLPFLVLKLVSEVALIVYTGESPWWRDLAVVVGLLISWTYSNVIYLSGCVFFSVICSLQVIQYENYGKLLEREMDVTVYIEEHMQMTHDLSKISHRFRAFVILEFIAVTASQFVALVKTTAGKQSINLINGGDFVVSSVLEVGGLLICLHAAAKVTHRAQGVASVATKWHSLVTCAAGNNGKVSDSPSGSDLESIVGTNTAGLASQVDSYQKRNALVIYLISNPGGITVYGYAVDRGLINTIFFIELSLVLFVLGKTITF